MSKQNKLFITIKYVALVLYLLTAFFIVYEAVLDSNASSADSGKLTNFLLKFNLFKQLYAETPAFNDIVRKFVGHFLVYFALATFGLLTFRLFISDKKYAILASLISGLIWAAVCELLQMIPSGRAPAFQDVVLNYEGYLSGHLITMVILEAVLFKNKAVSVVDFTIYFLSLLTALLNMSLFYMFSEKTLQLLFCNGMFLAVIILSFSSYIVVKCFQIKHLSKLKSENAVEEKSNEQTCCECQECTTIVNGTTENNDMETTKSDIEASKTE